MVRRSFTPPELSDYRDEWRMSPGIVSNGLLFLTGMTGRRADNTIAQDVEQQIRDAFAKIESVLKNAGLDMSRIVEMTSFHVGINDTIDTFRKVRDEHLTAPYAAWTAIEVSGFIGQGAIVEIRVIADATPD